MNLEDTIRDLLNKYNQLERDHNRLKDAVKTYVEVYHEDEDNEVAYGEAMDNRELAFVLLESSFKSIA